MNPNSSSLGDFFNSVLVTKPPFNQPLQTLFAKRPARQDRDDQGTDTCSAQYGRQHE